MMLVVLRVKKNPAGSPVGFYFTGISSDHYLYYLGQLSAWQHKIPHRLFTLRTVTLCKFKQADNVLKNK
jgi:hypothetical protein